MRIFVFLSLVLSWFTCLAEQRSDSLSDVNNGLAQNAASNHKTVFIAILAKDKEHVLPSFLKCIENQEYDKKLLTIYIRTNNNLDNTREILKEWVDNHKDLYKHIIFDDRNLDEVPVTNPHEWTPERWNILGKIRNESLKEALKSSCDYYFVVDCDNFIAPCTLKTLISKDKPIIAPLLRSINKTNSPYSNFFCDIDNAGYYKDHSDYNNILNRDTIGTFKVPVVHHVYLIKTDYIDKLNYLDESNDWLFIIFSRNARKNGVDQYICNEEDFGTFLLLPHTTTLEEEKKVFQIVVENYKRLDSYSLETRDSTKRSRSTNEQKLKRILVLIIASDNHPAFIELQKKWRSYMHLNQEHIEAYFIKGDPDIAVENKIIGDIIFTKITDSYMPGILKKTTLSMEFMLDKIKTFDYVLRTNLSSFYDFPQLLRFINTLPKNNCYCALSLTPFLGDVPEKYRVPFGWGAGFILSPDLVEMMVRNKEELFQMSDEVPDDVLIGAFFYRRNIKIIPSECHVFVDRMDWFKKKDSLPQNAFHFRAKSQYGYRKERDKYDDELFIISEFIKNFYPCCMY